MPTNRQKPGEKARLFIEVNRTVLRRFKRMSQLKDIPMNALIEGFMVKYYNEKNNELYKSVIEKEGESNGQ